MPLIDGWYFIIYEGAPRLSTKVVLVHGAGGSHLSWTRELRRLPGWRVLALDLPGHGRSEEKPCRRVEDYARRLVHFLDMADIYRVALVGHSMGSAVCLQAAPRLGDRLAGMALLAPFSRLPVEPDVLEYLSHPFEPAPFHRWLRERLFSPRTPERVILQAMRGLEQVRWHVLASDWMACSRFQPRHVDQITCPALLVAGADDRLTPPALAQELADTLPDARVKMLPRAGHMLALEQSAAVADAVERFLKTLPST